MAGRKFWQSPSGVISPRKAFEKGDDPLEEFRREPSITYADLGGLEREKREMWQIVMQSIRSNIESHVILKGPPGTGKTTLVEATAGQLEQTLEKSRESDSIPREKREILKDVNVYYYVIPQQRIVSSVYGKSEENMYMILKAAREKAVESPSGNIVLVVINDAESLLGSRESSDSIQSRFVSALLSIVNYAEPLIKTDRKSYASVVFAYTTNYPEKLDEAVVRRLSVIDVDPPKDAEERKKIIEKLLLRDTFDDDFRAAVGEYIDFIAANTQGYTPGDLLKVLTDLYRRGLSDVSLADVKESVRYVIGEKDILSSIDRIPPSALQHIERKRPRMNFEGLPGYSTPKNEVYQLLLPIKDSEISELYGFGEGSGAVLLGGPDMKVLKEFGEAMAGEIKRNIVYVDLREFLDPRVGMSEKRTKSYLERVYRGVGREGGIVAMEGIEPFMNPRTLYGDNTGVNLAVSNIVGKWIERYERAKILVVLLTADPAVYVNAKSTPLGKVVALDVPVTFLEDDREVYEAVEKQIAKLNPAVLAGDPEELAEAFVEEYHRYQAGGNAALIRKTYLTLEDVKKTVRNASFLAYRQGQKITPEIIAEAYRQYTPPKIYDEWARIVNERWGGGT